MTFKQPLKLPVNRLTKASYNNLDTPQLYEEVETLFYDVSTIFASRLNEGKSILSSSGLEYVICMEYSELEKLIEEHLDKIVVRETEYGVCPHCGGRGCILNSPSVNVNSYSTCPLCIGAKMIKTKEIITER